MYKVNFWRKPGVALAESETNFAINQVVMDQISTWRVNPFNPKAGLKINEKIQLQFCDRIPTFSSNLATLSRRIFAVHFHVSGLAKLNMSPQYLRVKKPLKMANDQKNTTFPVFTAMFERSNIEAKLRFN